ncbi:abc multidrug [Ceraceosorus bombacis]|uniref:Abc multidrug n=1 Tax=Ceraceosorus bombacis TaxID=401625 RepID=A0A0P1BRE8_9BASI|nr:abc multidrug [Ceraceosorus bombacis]
MLCSSDGSFAVRADCRGFTIDFTVAFEDDILSILPDAIFILAAVARCGVLFRRSMSKSPLRARGSLYAARVLIASAYVIVRVAALGLLASRGGLVSTTIPSYACHWSPVWSHCHWSTWNIRKRPEKFDRAWNGLAKRSKKGKPPLLLTLCLAFPSDILGTFPPGIVWILATFAQPFLLSDLLDFTRSYQGIGEQPEPVYIGIGLVCAFALVYAIIALSFAHTQVASVQVCVKVRGAMLDAIFRKGLVLHLAASRETGSSAAYNLLSSDMERLAMALIDLPETWTSLIAIGFGLWLLWREIGVLFLTALGMLFLLALILPALGELVDRGQDRYSTDSDARLKTTASVVDNIRPLKLSGYISTIFAKTAGQRRKEIRSLRAYFAATGFALMTGNVLPVWLEVIVFGAYGGNVAVRPELGETLGTVNTFRLLNILNAMTDSLVNAAIGFPGLYGALVSLRRVQSFLQLSEKFTIPSNSKLREDDTGEFREAMPADTHSQSSPVADGEKKSEQEPDVLTLRRATFKSRVAEVAEGKNPILLHELDLRVPAGTFTVVLGASGSGKSLLLHALLGEIDLVSGEFSSPWLREPSNIAYCQQDAWLVSGSIRSNIVMNNAFDALRYKRVLDATGLSHDLSAPGASDNNSVGSRGSMLSGGQRQRVALARALYSDAELFLFDDVLSAVDPTLATHIFESVLGISGLLRSKTVVMAGHDVANLNRADQLVVLESGRIAQKGDAQTLLSDPKSFVARFVDQQRAAAVEEKEHAQEVDEELYTKSEDEHDPVAGGDDEVVRTGTKTSRWKLYSFWFHHSGWIAGIVWFILAVALSVPYLLPQIILEKWAGINDLMPNRKAGTYIAALAAIAVGHTFMFAATIQILYQYLSPRGSIRMHDAMLKGILDAPLSWFDDVPSGRIVNRFAQDLYIVSCETPKYVFLMISNSADLVVLMAYTITATPYLAISIPPLVLVYYGLATLYTGASRQVRRLDLAAKSPLYQLFSEVYEGLASVRGYRMETSLLLRNRALLDASQKPFFLRFTAQAWLSLYLNLIVMIIAVVLTGLAVGLRDSVAVGFLGVALSSLVLISGTLNRILLFFTQVETSLVALERVREFTSIEPEGTNDRRGLAAETSKPVDEDWPARGAVDFKGVIVRYRPELEPALREVSFSFASGQKTAIVGRSGSGKSTLLMTLFRAVDLTSGSITIHVRENMSPDGSATDQGICDMLESVHLKEKIANMSSSDDTTSLGLDAQIDPERDGLSRGEKQLLCFARAVLQKRKILVLDEATSSIDHESDARLQHLIRTACADRTVITIAHRISTIADYDSVIVMEGGKLLEVGNPAALLRTSSSVFAALAQTGELELEREKKADQKKPIGRREEDMHSIDTELGQADEKTF